MFGSKRRGGQIGDALGYGEDGLQPELQTPGHGIIAGLDGVGDVAGEMGEADLMYGGVPLLNAQGASSYRQDNTSNGNPALPSATGSTGHVPHWVARNRSDGSVSRL